MKSYPEYKDSGIKWFGEIPSEWEIYRLKSLIPKSVNGVWGSDPEGNEGDLVCVRVADFNMDKFGVAENNLTYRNISLTQQKGRLLSRDNLLIEKSGGGEKQPVGRVVKYDLNYNAVCSNFIAKVECSLDVDPNYLVYLFSYLYSVGVNTRSIKQTTGIQNLDTGLYFNERISIPVKEEQTAIASFLDHKTQQIDNLVAKKERLIELLKEERTAVINQAVTKGLPAEARAKAGLDPNVPMKDSGIEWLGEIPEHWEVKKIKQIAFLKSGEGIKSEQIEETGEFPVYGGNGLRGYFSEYTHEGNFILIGRQGALCGNINCVSGKFWASEHAVVVDLSQEYDLLWASELLSAMNLNQYSISAAQPGLSVENIKNLKIPIPKLSEQKVIAKSLEELNKKNKDKIQMIEKEIQLLNEYKTSLINEAVTGKIDVREYHINHVTN